MPVIGSNFSEDLGKDRDTAAEIVEVNLPSYAPRSITPALPQGCTLLNLA